MKSWRFGRVSLFHQGDMSGADVDVSKFQLISVWIRETDHLLNSSANGIIHSLFQVMNESKNRLWRIYHLSHCRITYFNYSIFWHCSKSYPDSYPKKSNLSLFMSWKDDSLRKHGLLYNIVSCPLRETVSDGERVYVMVIKCQRPCLVDRVMAFFVSRLTETDVADKDTRSCDRMPWLKILVPSLYWQGYLAINEKKVYSF